MAKKSKADVAMAAEEMKWRTESDLRTLTEAAEIRKDPKRMKAVRALAKEKIAAVNALKEK
jgi:hypothetical protein